MAGGAAGLKSGRAEDLAIGLDWFARAQLLAPNLPYDPDLGTEPHTWYATVATLTRPTRTLIAPAEIVLDGTPIAAGETRSLRVGTHLLQAPIEGGYTTSWLIIPEAGPIAGGVLIEPERPEPRSPWPWVVSGTTLMVGGAGLLWGVMAVEPAVNDALLYKDQNPCTRGETDQNYETVWQCMAAEPELDGTYAAQLIGSIVGGAMVASGAGLVVHGTTLAVRTSGLGVELSGTW